MGIWKECGPCGLCPITGGCIILAVAVYQRAFLIYLVVNFPICYFLFLDCVMLPFAFFLLLCFDGIYTPLNFVEKYGLFSRGWVCTFLALIILCLNILLLDLYTYCHHYDTIQVSMWSLKAKLLSLLTDYLCVILVLLSVLIFTVAFLFLLATMFTNVLNNLRPQYDDRLPAFLLLFTILSTWCGCNLIAILIHNYLDARIFVDLELFLGRYFFLSPTVVFILLAMSYCCGFQFCWLTQSHRRSLSMPTPCGMFFLFCVIFSFTVAFIALVYGPATPLHKDYYCDSEDKFSTCYQQYSTFPDSQTPSKKLGIIRLVYQ